MVYEHPHSTLGYKFNLFKILCSNFAPGDPASVFEKQLKVELFVHTNLNLDNFRKLFELLRNSQD